MLAAATTWPDVALVGLMVIFAIAFLYFISKD